MADAGRRGTDGRLSNVLLVADSIRAREDFKADSDTDAVLIARVLCDACSDSYDSFELWQAKRKVDTAQQRRPMSFAEWRKRISRSFSKPKKHSSTAAGPLPGANA